MAAVEQLKLWYVTSSSLIGVRTYRGVAKQHPKALAINKAAPIFQQNLACKLLTQSEINKRPDAIPPDTWLAWYHLTHSHLVRTGETDLSKAYQHEDQRWPDFGLY